MVPNRVVRLAGLVVGSAALVFALLPFTVVYGDSLVTQQTVACRAPLVEVARPAPQHGGWYGYAPLTSTPIGRHTCHGPARHRLIVSAAGLVVAALLGWVSARIDGGRGRARRRVWRPHPA